MLGIVDAITNASSIAPQSMKVDKLAQLTSYQRPELGLDDLHELEQQPVEINENMLLAEDDRLGELQAATELAKELFKLRKKQRAEHLKIHQLGHQDRKDALAAAATITARNGEFARTVQAAQLTDRREEAYTTGYQRLRGDTVSMF